LIAFHDGIAESSGLSLVEAVAGVSFGLFGVRDVLAGASLIILGSGFGRRGSLGGPASSVPRKDSGSLGLIGRFHRGCSGALGLRCRNLSLDGGLDGRRSDRFSKSGTGRVPFSRSPLAEKFRGPAVLRARAFAHLRHSFATPR
jgi:hypothetical protein